MSGAMKFSNGPGFVLQKRPHNERYESLTFFSRTQGKLLCLYPIYKSKKANTAPDLLDCVELYLRQASNMPTFMVQESVLIQKFSAIAHDYQCFLRAFQFTNSICLTLQFQDTSPKLYDLLQKALNAWNAGKNAEIVFFKALFVWVKIEGYPIIQHWLTGLSAQDQVFIQTLLKTADDCLSLKNTSNLQDLNQNLISWTQNYTELRIQN
jgi:recombinational DNA repair protein (RecF pathway)